MIMLSQNKADLLSEDKSSYLQGEKVKTKEMHRYARK